MLSIERLRQRLLGPKVTRAEIEQIEFNAMTQGWYDFYVNLRAIHNRRRRNAWMAGIRDGKILIHNAATLHTLGDALMDDDPYENRD